MVLRYSDKPVILSNEVPTYLPHGQRREETPVAFQIPPGGRTDLEVGKAVAGRGQLVRFGDEHGEYICQFRRNAIREVTRTRNVFGDVLDQETGKTIGQPIYWKPL
jgi:hypothetical protein